MELINPAVMLSHLCWNCILKMHLRWTPPCGHRANEKSQRRWRIRRRRRGRWRYRRRLRGMGPSTSVNFTRCPKLNEVKMWKWTRKKCDRKNVSTKWLNCGDWAKLFECALCIDMFYGVRSLVHSFIQSLWMWIHIFQPKEIMKRKWQRKSQVSLYVRIHCKCITTKQTSEQINKQICEQELYGCTKER